MCVKPRFHFEVSLALYDICFVIISCYGVIITFISACSPLLAQPLFTEEANLLSLPERKFGVGWALLVEFIAATYFQTNFNETADQQTALPPRILEPSDKVPFIPDFTAAQNRVLLVIDLFHSTNVDTNGLLLKVWQRAMCSPEGRVVGRSILESVEDDPWIIARKIFELLNVMFIYPCEI